MMEAKANRRGIRPGCPILGADSRSENAARMGDHAAAAAPNAVRPGEEGYVLLIALFLLAVLVLSLAVAAPQIAKSIQRDRELETFHRGMQYRRAVQLYYRKFKAYPPNMDALVKTSDIRFLRKKYIDPMTGKDDWKSIAFGQNKTPTAMGFFGQPLAGNASTIAGTGPSGNNTPGMTNPTGSAFGGSGSAFGGSGSAFGGSGSAFGGSGSSFGGGGSIFGGSGSGSGQTPGSGAAGGTPGATGSSPSGTGSSGSSDSGTGTGLTGQTFGGAGIIGFEPASPKQSILVYKKKNHFNEWEFTYDPLSDMQTMGGGNTGGIGQPAGSTTSPVGTSPFGNPGSTTSPTTGGTGFGPGSGSTFGSSPSMPPDTSAPQ